MYVDQTNHRASPNAGNIVKSIFLIRKVGRVVYCAELLAPWFP